MGLHFGEDTYRRGALERLEDARQLLVGGQYAGAIYLAGRAVEGMLRGLLWATDRQMRRREKSLDTGHDLRELLKCVGSLGLLSRDPRDDSLRAEVQHVAKLWTNNMRFASTDQVARLWRELGATGRGRDLRLAARRYYSSCVQITKRCEQLWPH